MKLHIHSALPRTQYYVFDSYQGQNEIAPDIRPRRAASHPEFPSRVVARIVGAAGVCLSITAVQAWGDEPVKITNVDAGSLPTSVPPTTSPVAAPSLYANLKPKGFNIGLPGPEDTVDPKMFGLRDRLADLGIGFLGIDLASATQNVLSGVSRGNAGTQQYSGQRFTYTNNAIAGITYDLSRFGIPDGQLYVAGYWKWVSWAPLGPTNLGLSSATYYQTMFHRQAELKIGYTSNTWEFLNYNLGGNLASSVFGPSGSIPLQGGLSSNVTPRPGVNLTWHLTPTLYLKGGAQRAVNPDGTATEINDNPTGFKWGTPNSGTLYIGEAGYQRTAAEGVPFTWVRGGGAYNTSNSKSLEHPGTRVGHNSWYYLVADQQLWQTHPAGSPGRGVYFGASAMYAPPETNTVSQYYEFRLYGKGLIENRPYDLASLVMTDTIWSSYAIEQSASKGNMVHRDSKAITLSYSARLTPGVYAGLGVSYVNHPTSIAYQANTGSALNVLANLSIFF